MTSATTFEKRQRPKGTQDILPGTIETWQYVEEVIATHVRQAGYQEIRTPIFEVTDIFERGIGTDTDVVNKEMYTFEKGDRSLTLRPEGTAGVVRAYIENGLSRAPKPVKLYYTGPMFRYERPQAGRQRQFHQAGVEIFGLDTPSADAEMIYLAMGLFQKLGLTGLSLEVNNIGTAESRHTMKVAFRARLKSYLSQLCETCQTRYETNPLRMLDCKNEVCQVVYHNDDIGAFLAEEHTSPECQAHFQQLIEILGGLKVPYKRNHRLVRGLDYYTRTVFEITSTHLGAQNTVCGGGRYDGLVELLGGPSTPATGWALGMERLISMIKEPQSRVLDYYVVSDQPVAAFQLADQIREKGFAVEVDLSGKGFGKQLAQADKREAKQVVILGSEEIVSAQLMVKHMKTGEQQQVDRSIFLSGLG